MQNSAGDKRAKRALVRLDTSLVEYPRRLSSHTSRGDDGRSSVSKPRPDQPRPEQNLAGAPVRFRARTRGSRASAGFARPKALKRGTQKGLSHVQSKFSARKAVSAQEAARRSKAKVSHFARRAPMGPKKQKSRALLMAAKSAQKNSAAQVAVSSKETARRVKVGVAHFARREPQGPDKVLSKVQTSAEHAGELAEVKQRLAA